MALSLSVASTAYAPVIPHVPSARTHVRMGVDAMEGVGPETGNKMWDPLNLSGMCSDKTLAWYRAAELKHGRVAMAAWTGFFYMSTPAPLLQGKLALDGTTFASLGKDPFAAWDAVPASGKLQILLVLGAFEFVSETAKPHYMLGGTPGKVSLLGQRLFDPFNFISKLSPEKRAEKRASELKNGRLAMIGVMSVFAAHSIPGSVPAFGQGQLW